MVWPYFLVKALTKKISSDAKQVISYNKEDTKQVLEETIGQNLKMHVEHVFWHE